MSFVCIGVLENVLPEESELISADDFSGKRNWKLGRNLYDDSREEVQTDSESEGKSGFETQASILSGMMFDENKEDAAAQSMIKLSILHDKEGNDLEVYNAGSNETTRQGDSCPTVGSKNVNNFHVQKLIKNLQNDTHHDEEAPEDDLLAMMDAL